MSPIKQNTKNQKRVILVESEDQEDPRSLKQGTEEPEKVEKQETSLSQDPTAQLHI